MTLLDVIDPSKFAEFVRKVKEGQQADPLTLIAAETDVMRFAHCLPCSSLPDAQPCDCTVGTLLMLELYLRQQEVH